MNELKIVPESEFKDKELMVNVNVYKTKNLNLVIEVPNNTLVNHIIIKPGNVGYGIMY